MPNRRRIFEPLFVLVLALSPTASLAGQVTDLESGANKSPIFDVSILKLPDPNQADDERRIWEQKLQSAQRQVSSAKRIIIFGVAGGAALMIMGTVITGDEYSSGITQLGLTLAGATVTGASAFIGAMRYTGAKEEIESLQAQGRARGYTSTHLNPTFQVAWHYRF